MIVAMIVIMIAMVIVTAEIAIVIVGTTIVLIRVGVMVMEAAETGDVVMTIVAAFTALICVHIMMS
jgi:hypothetical protein